MADAKTVVVTGGFDDFKSHHVRFLEEASKLGDVYVLLWSDETVRALEGHPPKFPQEERLYLLQTDRYVKDVKAGDGAGGPRLHTTGRRNQTRNLGCG